MTDRRVPVVTFRKVPVRFVQTDSGGVRIETVAHISGGSGRPMWVELIEIPANEQEIFLREFLEATDLPLWIHDDDCPHAAEALGPTDPTDPTA